MIVNVGAGGGSSAKAVKYDNSKSGLESTNVQGAVDELSESLGGVSVDYGTLTLAKALASMCDNYMSSTNNMSYNGRFKCSEGWYSYNVYYSSSYWSGFVTCVTKNVSYSFYRLVGADAVLKELGDNAVVGNFIYTATTSTSQEINLGFRPSNLALTIKGSNNVYCMVSYTNGLCLHAVKGKLSTVLYTNQEYFQITDNGFKFTGSVSDDLLNNTAYYVATR